MKVLKKALLTLSVLSSFNVFALPVESKVEIITLVNSNRRSIKLIAKAKVDYAYVCSGAKVKVTLENPRLYMEVGEFEEVINDIFIYPQDDNKEYASDMLADKLLTVNNHSEDEIIIKKISVDNSKMRCRLASFYDYCSLAQKDELEKFSLVQVASRVNANNCISLNHNLQKKFPNRKRVLNLNDSYVMDFRFLRYLDSIKAVYVNNSFKDRSGYLYKVSTQRYLRISYLDSQQELPENAYDVFELIPVEEVNKLNKFEF